MIKFSLPVLLLLLLGACQKEAELVSSCGDTYIPSEVWKEREGQVGFDGKTDSYYIHYHIPGTIDAIISAYTCELPSEFRSEGIPVTVSGNLYLRENMPTPALAGQEIYYLDLLEIRETVK